MLRLLILSDAYLYREGVALLLTQALAPVAVRTAGSADVALAMLQHDPADVFLLDWSVPDVLNAARAVSTRFSLVKIVGLGVHDDEAQIVACAEAGMTGFVNRTGSTDDLVEAIRCASAGELACSRQIAGALVARVAALAGRIVPRATDAQLTQREIQVLRLVDEGLTNKEIAVRLHISAATARNHVHNILDRLGVRTRSRAAAVARRMLA